MDADEISTTLLLATPAEEAKFKCEHCPRTFTTLRGRSGHQTAHRHLWAPPPVNKKPRMDPPPAPIWTSPSDAVALGSVWRHENLFFSHFPWAWQTGVGLAPAQPSSAVSPRVAGGYSGTGRVSGVNEEETADEIDLTLKL